MAVSPESMPENPNDFRAPPPSPVASGRRSSVTNDEDLTEFLEHSLRVPDLILPDKIFPRQKIVETPPRIDYQSLNAAGSDSVLKMLDWVERMGCFQLINYGIPTEFIRLAMATAVGIFGLPPEKKAAVVRSLERPYGFEEFHGDQEAENDELSEEFFWCKDNSLKLDMEGIWPMEYSNFSDQMETLLSEIGNVAAKILLLLIENYPRESRNGNDHHMMQRQEDILGSVCCCLYKHRRHITADRWASSLGYDVIKMLIKGTDFSHALCLHICDASSEFHVYTKKGWMSFCPDKDALVVTIGDQTQAWSGGQYKHVLGKPIFKDENEDRISAAIFFSPASTSTSGSTNSPGKGKTISLGQQVMLAIILTLVCRFVIYVYKEC